MRYATVCSGIEAPSVAWHPLGWQSAFFSEIDKFPCAVLAHHYPDVPNLGDMTKFKRWPDATFDVFCGGTPCQSFSVAGLRKGLADPRGNLMLTYLAIADRYRPRWLVWENVPGVLSDAGNAFGAFLGGLGQLGYGFAYRVLDAQYCGVPQRRRRVFVVGHLGDWRRAAAVLFERHSLQGHPAPSRQTREGIAPTISARTKGGGGLGTDFDLDGGVICRDIAHAVACHMAKGGDTTTDNYVAHSLRAEGFDASEDRMGRGTPLVPIAIQGAATRENAASGPDGVGVRTDGQAYTLEARQEVQAVAFQSKASHHQSMNPNTISPTLEVGKSDGVAVCAAFSAGQTEGAGTIAYQEEQSPTLRGGASGTNQVPALHRAMQVRRLTPRECERLQGFTDDYTLIPFTHGKPAADGPRYKALGNSMAIPVVQWIGKRIGEVEGVING